MQLAETDDDVLAGAAILKPRQGQFGVNTQTVNDTSKYKCASYWNGQAIPEPVMPSAVLVPTFCVISVRLP